MNDNRKYFDSLKNIGPSLLSEGTTIRIKAHGYSMYPSIKPGSLLIIEPLKLKGDPRKGEIVAIRRENGLIVHRLVRIIIRDGKRYYIARGDSNSMADNPVPLEMIAGRVTGSEPTGENPLPANISANHRPLYFINRIRVIFIMIRNRLAS
ncbi:MAG TPA: signal peptidase I [Bacteroidales bacterium]|nr:signal peptidase I [Bacteroidales bacterium]